MADESASKSGYVYVLVNSALPGLVKIGRTRGPARARAQELSRGTATPTPFIVAYDELVSDCIEVESRLHKRFEANRESQSREFFRVEPKEAILALQMAARLPSFGEQRILSRLDVLPAFDSRCRRWLRRDLIGLYYLQTASHCILESVVQDKAWSTDLRSDRTDLGFIGDYEGGGPYFDPKLPAEDNARKLTELDSYSVIMCLDIFDHEVAQWIARQYEGEGEAPFSANGTAV